MGNWKPAYANYCETCGKNWNTEFVKIKVDRKNMNYCPTCGNELGSTPGGDMK